MRPIEFDIRDLRLPRGMEVHLPRIRDALQRAVAQRDRQAPDAFGSELDSLARTLAHRLHEERRKLSPGESSR